jgi:hypothetical protein
MKMLVSNLSLAMVDAAVRATRRCCDGAERAESVVKIIWHNSLVVEKL